MGIKKRTEPKKKPKTKKTIMGDIPEELTADNFSEYKLIPDSLEPEKPWRSVIPNPFGKPPKYTPEELWQKFLDYMEWNMQNPLYTVEARTTSNGQGFGSSVEHIRIPKMRAMTETAFCIFAGINRDSFAKYKSGTNGKIRGFKTVAWYIADCIYTQKFEGASAGLLSAIMISRDLGLVDKVENTNKNINSVNLSNKQIIKTLKNLEDLI